MARIEVGSMPTKKSTGPSNVPSQSVAAGDGGVDRSDVLTSSTVGWDSGSMRFSINDWLLKENWVLATGRLAYDRVTPPSDPHVFANGQD